MIQKPGSFPPTGTRSRPAGRERSPATLSLAVHGLALAAVFGLLAAVPAPADDVPAGIDLLTSPGDTFVDFAPNPIPLGFFGTGSDEFTGLVPLVGQPLPQSSGPAIAPADTIVRRLQPAPLVCGGGAPTIDIELLALNLVGTGSIQVTFDDGTSSQAWNVRVCRSATAPSTGTMTIQQTCATGGSFTSDLTVVPKFVFTRVSDGEQRVLDPGTSVSFTAAGNWVHDPGTTPVITAGAGVQVDGDCDGLPDPALDVGTSANFFPGIQATPCDSCAALVPNPPSIWQKPVPHIPPSPYHKHAVQQATETTTCPPLSALDIATDVTAAAQSAPGRALRTAEARADLAARLPRARNFDARGEENRGVEYPPGADQLTALERLRERVPGLMVRFERTTGATRSLSNPMGDMTQETRGGSAKIVALTFVGEHLDALGLAQEDLEGYEVTDEVYSAVSGTTHLYLRQTYEGIPIYNGQLQVHVTREGRILSVNNAFLPGLRGAVNTLRAARGAEQAVAGAAEHLGLELPGAPAVLSVGDDPQETTLIDGTGISLEDIEAKLFLLPIRRGTARLVWNFRIQTLDGNHWYDLTVDALTGKVWTRFDWANDATYKVYGQPTESPNHTVPLPPVDARTLVTDPHFHATNASPFGWHHTSSACWTLAQGNNVHACHDRDADNICSLETDCGPDLRCDFPLDLTQAPSASGDAAVSNLFYWSNVIHDVQYQYGFDEVGGNFQEDNFGRGGAGSDSVNADAQDGSGNCNANFSTPTDGGNPRMQMFVCGNTSPARDGDLDNGVIVHEYGHGISIRQVGGPSNSSCLNNTQQPGEGWSDWFGLVYTAEVGDAGPDARGVGSYLFALPAEGGTIRDLPYSTDNAVNNWTYESIAGASVPHGVGSRWAQALWEVYWKLVDKYGFNLDLYDALGGSGNQRVLLYVNEGLKNTACSPTFLDARDGIIQAAVTLNGGEDVCPLWQAFADYGLGTDASTAGSGSTTATNGFAIPVECQCSPQPIADAGPAQIICLSDSATLGTPAQAGHTYSWSPGGQTTAQITVSPTVTTTYTVTATTACGSAQDPVTVTVDDGTGGAGLSDDFEGDNSDWTATGLWHQTTDSVCAAPGYSSPLNAFYYGQDATCTYDTGAANSGTLTSPAIGGITASSTLTFDYYRVVESFAGDFDRTQVNIVTSTGSTTVFSLNSSNASTAAWVSSGPISLSAFAGQTIQVQFLFDTVDGVGNNFTGWLIDDVVVTGQSPCSEPSTLPKGLDLWSTPEGGAEIQLDVPQDFFCPGSAAIPPTDPPHLLKGEPLLTSPPGVLGDTDTVVDRPQDAVFANGTATTPLIIRALSLASTTPLTVDCPPGEDQWQVKVTLDGPQTPGSITIHSNAVGVGGTFDATFDVVGKVAFINISTGRRLGPLPDPLAPHVITTLKPGVWSPAAGTGAAVHAGSVRIDSNGNGTIEASSCNPAGNDFFSPYGNDGKFFPGWQPATPPVETQTMHDGPHSVTTPARQTVSQVQNSAAFACIVDDDFEGGAACWSNDPSSTCTTGAYVTGDPTNPSGGVQIVGSHSGVTSIFTAANSSAGVDDVDGGNCILGSPVTPWSVANASTLSVWYWHGQRDNADDPNGDFFRLEYSTDGGTSWNLLASNGDATSTAVWTEATAPIPAGSQIRLRMQCSDGSAAGDLIECGIDDFSICGN